MLGPIAAGKSTARRFAAAALRDHGWVGDVITVEECQREVCPPGAGDGRYLYDASGALILLDRDRQAHAARKRFAEKCYLALPKGFIAEIGQPRASQFLFQEARLALSGAIVLHVTAPLTVRETRNGSRTEANERMPAEVLTWIEEGLSPEDANQMGSAGARVYELDSNVLLENYLDEVRRILVECYHELGR